MLQLVHLLASWPRGESATSREGLLGLLSIRSQCAHSASCRRTSPRRARPSGATSQTPSRWTAPVSCALRFSAGPRAHLLGRDRELGAEAHTPHHALARLHAVEHRHEGHALAEPQCVHDGVDLSLTLKSRFQNGVHPSCWGRLQSTLSLKVLRPPQAWPEVYL